jgi:hypothetical protein
MDYKNQTDGNASAITNPSTSLLSDNAILGYVGKLKSQPKISIALYQQHILITDRKTGESIFNIPLGEITEINKAIAGGQFNLKFADNNINIVFNSFLSRLLLGIFVLFRGNDKSKLWVDTINQYRNTGQTLENSSTIVG